MKNKYVRQPGLMDVPRWMKGFLVLIVSLVMVSGCTPGLVKLNEGLELIASPNFVAEHLPRMLAIEKTGQEIIEQLQYMSLFSVSLEDIKEGLIEAQNLYWVHYQAANVYLVDGDLDRFVQAAAKAEHNLQKMKDLINSLSPDESTNPDPSIKSL